MRDFFKNTTLDRNKMVCCSGGATGSDTVFEETSIKYGIKVYAFSYQTPKHKSINKVEISKEDYDEGVLEIKKANKILKRSGIDKYMNLLARNWSQVKYSDQIFAVGTILKPNQKNNRGYPNKAPHSIVDGGTGYATTMGILNQKELFVFEQNENKWFRWSYIKNEFMVCDEEPVITCEKFAGIGTREINQNGIEAIENLYKRSFGI